MFLIQLHTSWNMQIGLNFDALTATMSPNEVRGRSICPLLEGHWLANCNMIMSIYDIFLLLYIGNISCMRWMILGVWKCGIYWSIPSIIVLLMYCTAIFNIVPWWWNKVLENMFFIYCSYYWCYRPRGATSGTDALVKCIFWLVDSCAGCLSKGMFGNFIN